MVFDQYAVDVSYDIITAAVRIIPKKSYQDVCGC